MVAFAGAWHFEEPFWAQWETPLWAPQIATILISWLFLIVSWHFEEHFWAQWETPLCAPQIATDVMLWLFYIIIFFWVIMVFLNYFILLQIFIHIFIPTSPVPTGCSSGSPDRTGGGGGGEAPRGVRYIDKPNRLTIYRHLLKISISISIRTFLKISISIPIRIFLKISISIRTFLKILIRSF